MTKIPILLLAAGSSTRMGQSKQLLPWGNQTLIEHLIQTLLKTGNPVNVVLGSNSNLVIPVIEKLNVNIFINNDWEKGMGSSIGSGINQLTKSLPAATGVLITLLDQPFITTFHLLKMMNTFQPEKKQIIVSQSASGWKGVPALFDNYYFEELTELKGEEGAKIIIRKYMNAVIGIDCGEIPEDMDTLETYQKLLNRYKSSS